MSVFDNDLPAKCNPDKKEKKRKKITHSSIEIRKAVAHGGWTVNVITFFDILGESFVKAEHSTLSFTLKNE